MKHTFTAIIGKPTNTGTTRITVPKPAVDELKLKEGIKIKVTVEI